MSIVDLGTRLTQDHSHYARLLTARNSLIYISEPVRLDDGPSSLELHVGDAYHSLAEDVYLQIPEAGIKLRPGESVVVDSLERVGLPANVFGLVSGKGRYIFQGIMLSPGKIDPKFDDHLRIGLFNAGKGVVTLKRGDPLCTCAFVSMEGMSEQGAKTRPNPAPKLPSVPFFARVKAGWSREYYKFAPIIGALLGSLITAAVAYYIYRHPHPFK